MICHLVAFSLKPHVTDEERDRLLGQLRGLSSIPSVRRLSVGAGRIRKNLPPEYQWVLRMDFEDQAGRDVYTHHPDHVAVSPELVSRASEIKTIDFDC